MSGSKWAWPTASYRRPRVRLSARVAPTQWSSVRSWRAASAGVRKARSWQRVQVRRVRIQRLRSVRRTPASRRRAESWTSSWRAGTTTSLRLMHERVPPKAARMRSASRSWGVVSDQSAARVMSCLVPRPRVPARQVTWVVSGPSGLGGRSPRGDCHAPTDPPPRTPERRGLSRWFGVPQGRWARRQRVVRVVPRVGFRSQSVRAGGRGRWPSPPRSERRGARPTREACVLRLLSGPAPPYGIKTSRRTRYHGGRDVRGRP